MRAVIQRVAHSKVTVDNKVIAEIESGLLVLLGISRDDTEKDADYLAEKIPNLRIFEDDTQKMNRSLIDTHGEILVVSQFTLLGDCRKGRRPSYIDAAPPEKANELYHYFADRLMKKKIRVKTGQFQAMMDVTLTNSGPVTIIVESKPT